MMLDKNLLDKDFFNLSTSKTVLLDLVFETANILSAQAQMNDIKI